MSDVRGLFERLTDVEPTSSALEVLERAERQAVQIEGWRTRRRLTTIGLVAVLLVGAVLVAAHAGGKDRGTRAPTEERPNTPTTTANDLYEVDAAVEQNGTKPPVLCLGPQLASDSPICGGLPIAGWDWAKVKHETSNGITQGNYHLVGTFNGTTFTPTEPPTAAHAPPPPKRRSYEPPCPTPTGGWTVVDPSRLTQSDSNAFLSAVQHQPDSAGYWLNNSRTIYTVAFTGDLDRHRAQLRALWGGPICVVQHKHSTAELDATARSLEESRMRLTFRGVTPDPFDDVVHVEVWATTPVIRQALDRKYGAGLIDLIGYLTPVSAQSDAGTPPGTSTSISTTGPAVPTALLILQRAAATELEDPRPTSVQIVKTTLLHAETVVFNDATAVTQDGTQPVWVAIMKGPFTNRSAQGPSNATITPKGDTSAAIYSDNASLTDLDSAIGNLTVTAPDLGEQVTTVTW
jgi:hypothetical protein